MYKRIGEIAGKVAKGVISLTVPERAYNWVNYSLSTAVILAGAIAVVLPVAFGDQPESALSETRAVQGEEPIGQDREKVSQIERKVATLTE